MWSGFPTVSEMPLGENPLHIYGCLSSLRTPLLLSIPPANPQRSLSLRLSGCPALIHYAGHSHWEWCLLHCFTASHPVAVTARMHLRRTSPDLEVCCRSDAARALLTSMGPQQARDEWSASGCVHICSHVGIDVANL
eukprot:GGOE01031597.1.p2 GENE.GGOE01031597.1~~GGOE01031597.1.p2  ORF type:complete len:137 (+),score=7.07 GGOE01031597.1:517-927(+)